ncbi:MAG TPA: PIN domain-containing protein [Stellaceae bacterium]|nr:PIN domain-containing protein [Stellaceae bacterium]
MRRVLSGLPNAGVVAWLAEADEDRIFLSVMTLAELRYGIGRMAAGNRRRRLDEWLGNELPLRFDGRILSIDNSIADAGGKVVASREAMGRPISAADAFIIATVEVHELTLVTRNVQDFTPTLTALVNPWGEG